MTLHICGSLYVSSKYSLHVKFIYSEKATKFCEISTLLLTVCTVVKSKVEISRNFVAFSEYMNFEKYGLRLFEQKVQHCVKNVRSIVFCSLVVLAVLS